MEALDIIRLAVDQMTIVGPALLVISALCVADLMIDFVVRVMKSASRQYRV